MATIVERNAHLITTVLSLIVLTFLVVCTMGSQICQLIFGCGVD